MPALPPTMIRPMHSLESLLIDSLPSFLLPVACLTSSPFSRGRHYITYVACCERSLKDICINCWEFQFTQFFPGRLHRSFSWIYFKTLNNKYIFSMILKNIIKVINTSYKYYTFVCKYIPRFIILDCIMLLLWHHHRS